MLLSLADASRVLVVGGKGGVGKTAVASAVALEQSRRGRRVLLVSTDPAHNLGHLWGCDVGDDGVEVAPGLDALEIDPQRTTDAHLRAVGATLRRLMPEHLAGEVDRHLALARDAPGMHEAAILERLAHAVDAALDDHDLVVVDTAPSGHTARLMALPEVLTAWTEGLLRREQRVRGFAAAERSLDPDGVGEAVTGWSGRAEGEPGGAGGTRGRRGARRDDEIREVLLRRRDRFESLRRVLTDAERTAFVIVLAAERLPVLETVELHEQLVRSGVRVGGLVVNKRSPADAGELLAARRAQEEEHLRTLRSALPGVPTVEVPLLADDVTGADALARLAALLDG